MISRWLVSSQEATKCHLIYGNLFMQIVWTEIARIIRPQNVQWLSQYIRYQIFSLCSWTTLTRVATAHGGAGNVKRVEILSIPFNVRKWKLLNEIGGANVLKWNSIKFNTVAIVCYFTWIFFFALLSFVCHKYAHRSVLSDANTKGNVNSSNGKIYRYI